MSLLTKQITDRTYWISIVITIKWEQFAINISKNQMRIPHISMNSILLSKDER